MNEMSLARDLAVIGGVALFGGIGAKIIRLPLVIGYIIAGILFNSFFGSFISDRINLGGIANIGIALLLFSLGIEFSFRRLTKIKTLAVRGVVLQIIFTAILIALACLFLKMSVYESIFFGSVASLSSTAIVVKILSEKGELETVQGDLSVNWLLVQDLSVLPLTLILPALSLFTGNNIVPHLVNLFKVILLAGFVIYLILFLGRKLMPKILEKIGTLNSRELMLLTSVFLSIFFAFIFQSLGLSFALGAFVAGLFLSSSFQNHALFAEIRPVRDLFSMVFFVLLGMMTSLKYFRDNFGIIILLTIITIIVKYLVVFYLVKSLKYHAKVASRVSVNLIQIGEFAFVISLSALNSRLISPDFHALIISVALLTIILTPIFMDKWELFRKKIFSAVPDPASFPGQPAESGLTPPLVIICGYGRVGKHVGEILLAHQIPFLVVDLNQEIVRVLRLKNIPVLYGDPAEFGVLNHAGVDKAAVLVIAIPDRFSQEQIILNSLNLNQNLVIICRSHVLEDKHHLLKRGAKIIVQPEFEASLSISHKILEIFNIPPDQINTTLKSLRENHEKNIIFEI